MRQSLSRPEPGKPRGASPIGDASGVGRRGALRAAPAVIAPAVATLVPAAALAQLDAPPATPPQGSGNRHFTAVPGQKGADEESGQMVPDAIMGVHINTIFLVVVGVAALYWFTIGGGRRAKIKKLGRTAD